MKENQKAWASQSQEILKYLKKHGGDSKKKDSEGRSCKKIGKSFHNPIQGCDINDKEKNISSIENYFCINSNSTFPANIAK